MAYGENMYNTGFICSTDSRQAAQRKLIKSDQEANTVLELIRGAKFQLN